MENQSVPIVLDDATSRIVANSMGRIFYSHREDVFSILGFESSLNKASPQNAVMIGSLCEDGMHAPVLDIDFPAQLREFKNGKQELILDIVISKKRMKALKLISKIIGIGSFENSGNCSRIKLDCPAILVPSQTSGHFHLYLETKMPQSTYEGFLAALVCTGVIEREYYNMSIRNQKTTVVLPWIKRKEALPSGY